MSQCAWSTVEKPRQSLNQREHSQMGALGRRGAILGGTVCCTLIVILLFPHAIDLYHLQAGGRTLEKALGETDLVAWWYVGPREVRDTAALQRAIVHLRQADTLAHAWRLLGRARVAEGEILESIEALEQFTALRPDNPLGHLELAAAYELADRRLNELVYADLMHDLSGAGISAPDLEGETLYDPSGWQSEYVYPTSFRLPPNDEDRPTLFLHAGSSVTYTLTLTRPAVLRFGMGLAPESLDWGGDGATFEVFVNGERVFLEHLEVDLAREGWQEREVDLAGYAGRKVFLSLVTTPGPITDITADWAGWGAPRIEAFEATVYRQVMKDRSWRGEWAKAGITTQDLINVGEAARRAKQYDEALHWYRWAMWLEPEPGDPWYYAGLAYEGQEQWTRALDAYERALALDRFRQVGRSSPHYRVGMIYHLRLEPRQVDTALAAYEVAIKENNFRADWEAADCHYKRGAALRQQKANSDEYIAEYRQAIALDPEHIAAHIQLGLAIYERDQDASLAEAELLKAAELAPQNKWVYYHLGEIYRREGRTDEAKAMYEQALGIAPDFEAAHKRLMMLNKTE